MNGWRVAAVIALLLIWHTQVARAAGVEGAGARSCAYFIQNYKTDPAAEEHYFGWAQGYMSGLNVARLNDEPGRFQSMSMEQQREHIRTFCTANPTKEYFYAVVDLYTALYPRQTNSK